jgi:branched-chain amino acid transport system ATP-binding protein
MNPLVVEQLTKRFGGLLALSGVGLSIESGERRAIIGPNGAGKTTFFNLITGTLPPSSGRILLFGQDVTHMPTHHRARLGLARTFQITTLFPNLSVLDNVLLAVQSLDPARFVLHRSRTAYPHLLSRGRALLEQWGLAEQASTRVRALSYGEQRQVELILALAGAPKLLLLDEPTAGLSPAETATVSSMIKALSREMAILIIEHDMDVAFELADRITVLHQGRVLAEGSGEEIRKNPEVAEIYLGTQ